MTNDQCGSPMDPGASRPGSHLSFFNFHLSFLGVPTLRTWDHAVGNSLVRVQAFRRPILCWANRKGGKTLSGASSVA